LVTTKNNVTPNQLQLMESITKNILQAGGSGKKVIFLVYLDFYGVKRGGRLNGIPGSTYIYVGHLCGLGAHQGSRWFFHHK
jgi:hypothetical protein